MTKNTGMIIKLLQKNKTFCTITIFYIKLISENPVGS